MAHLIQTSNNAFRDPFSNVQGERTLQRIERYWQSLRNGRQLPAREDIQSYDIDDLLTHCFIAEHSAPGVIKVRVAGQNIQQLLNCNPKGQSLGALLTPTTAALSTRILENTFTSPEIIEISLRSQKRIMKPTLNARLLCLPLRAQGDSVTRMFGVFVCDKAPSRFRTDTFELNRDPIIRRQNLQPFKNTLRLASSAAVVNCNRDINNLDTKPTTKQPKHLRLVVSNA